MTGMIRSQLNEGVIPLRRANIKTTIKLRPRLIRAEVELARTTRYLGILILRMRSPLATTELAPVIVASLKKFQRTIPSKR
ncbi:hypothetical protein D3C85_1669440 [compost metagenome]